MNDYTITSVQRALRILKLFLPDNQPMTLKQIADESDLNKSTALRMTTTLLNEKFLSYNRRFAELAEQTAAGLQVYGMLDPATRENLTRLASLARSLETISRKELQNERLSDEEYDLIREYGGTLEHFWIEAVKDRTDAEYLDAREIPASLVTDLATDPNGMVLQAANGRPAQIYVIVPVDGMLRIASGVVYNFYQFRQPLSARLTDSEWRQMIGEWMSPDGRFHQDETPEKPGWTQSYWVQG